MTSTHASTAAPSWSAWLALLPRGISEIFFQSNVWTGLLILAAFVVADWQMAVMVVIGTICSTVTGYLLHVDTEHFELGFQGFNGALVGAAAYTALGDQGWAYVLSAVGGVACVPLTWAFFMLFGTAALRRFSLPYTTAPFCITAGIIYVCTTSIHVRSTPQHVADGTGESVLRSLLTNVSEVVLVNSVWGGALILIGLFIASWQVGLAAVLGSVVGSLCALALGETSSTIDEGLAGYSGVLTAIALSVTFLSRSVWSWLYATVGAAITAVVTLAMTNWYGDPHYTWPYILTTWVLLIVAASIPALRSPASPPDPARADRSSPPSTGPSARPSTS